MDVDELDGEQKDEYSPVLGPSTMPTIQMEDDDEEDQADANATSIHKDATMQSLNQSSASTKMDTHNKKLNLSDVLDGRADHILTNNQSVSNALKLSSIEGYGSSSEGDETDNDADQMGNTPHQEGFCIECDDVPAVGKCVECDDDYCEVCDHHQHRKGHRKEHTLKLFPGAEMSGNESMSAKSRINGNNKVNGTSNSNIMGLPSLTAMNGATASSKSPKAGTVLSFLRLRPKV